MRLLGSLLRTTSPSSLQPGSSHLSSVRCRPRVPVAMANAGSVDHDEYHARWEEQYWKPGLKPGQAFDAAKPSPAFTNLLSQKVVDIAGKRVLVPGCGRGYDLLDLYKAGAAEVVGLELAPTAVKAATAYLKEEGLDPSCVHVAEGNFFSWSDEKGPFDAGYDYTFMCALHPDMRADWAAGWARLLKPGGLLKTLIFPVDPERQTGPPWPVTPELYEELLTKNGFVCKYLEPVPAEMSHDGRGGKEYMAIWEKQ